MATSNNNSAILDVVAVNKEILSMKDTVDVDSHHLHRNSNNYEHSPVSGYKYINNKRNRFT